LVEMVGKERHHLSWQRGAAKAMSDENLAR
jgi:hypothetical protein